MRLCLVTCNIRFDNPADGDNSWIHRRQFLMDTLLGHSPDVIATQEGRHDQLLNMSGMLPEFELIDRHRSWITERMYPSFFIRKGRFDVVKSEDRWLSETPRVAGSSSFGSAFPRLFTWIKLRPLGGGTPLFFVNTHLDHMKAETRVHQTEVLCQEVKRFWEVGTPLIIMGDFNDSPTSAVRKVLEGKFPALQDAWSVFNSTEETSHHAFTGEMQNGARIDWILVDKRLKLESCQMDKTQKNGKFPTDHFPVVCTVST